VCGISGVVTRGTISPGMRSAAQRMSAALIHRGPDGSGEFFSEHVGLLSRRLSIIDVDGGAQPLHSQDNSLVLIMNGEIYNYVELREHLTAKGNRFLTKTDSEVILHLYSEHGLDFIDHLRGMFAIALWDVKLQKLVLARDRMGEKPLYLVEREDEIYFASELKSLLHAAVAPFELDPRAIDLYFHYQYVPEPLTPIKGIRKLQAARMLVIETENWNISEHSYWRLADSSPIDGRPSEIIRQRLEDVSEQVVRSDVPIGVALSGGLDSSVVAALAARRQPNIAAFTVGYSDRPESDERDDAALFARDLNIPFVDVELSSQDVVVFFPELNYLRDDPVADISGFGYYAVAKLASENGVKVLLQGHGGDELFWGYPQLLEAVKESLRKCSIRSDRPPSAVRRLLSFIGIDGRDQVSGKWNTASELSSSDDPDRMVFYDRSPDFRDAFINAKNFYTESFKQQVNPMDAFSLFTFHGEWPHIPTALTELVCATYLRGNGIVQSDRLGMASSVETRLPFMDHKLVEAVVGLRKVHSDIDLPPKSWLRDAVKDLIPPWVLERPKRGFAPPTREWHKAIFEKHGHTLKDGFLVDHKILSAKAGQSMSRGDFPGSVTSPLSFKALVLEQWCRQMTTGYCTN
jgi:asparagine synthase (glutamine-hydrolysing)